MPVKSIYLCTNAQKILVHIQNKSLVEFHAMAKDLKFNGCQMVNLNHLLELGFVRTKKNKK